LLGDEKESIIHFPGGKLAKSVTLRVRVRKKGVGNDLKGGKRKNLRYIESIGGRSIERRKKGKKIKKMVSRER